jgi:hypothetical protein
VSLRLLAEIAWQPVGLIVSYGVYRALRRTDVGRAGVIIGTAVALVALAWFPVAAAHLGARLHADAKLSQARVENAGAAYIPRLVPVIRKLRALIPPGDTYRIKTHSARVEYWTFTSLLPRIAEPRTDARADWLIVWMDRTAKTPPGATPLRPGVWAIHTAA